ncbi:MAG: cadherin-like domain-containing protein, partial [Emcibacteraceae bacterium]|nr:cadherin-like domain-containing protein [Emcibacteraceae bacterium]
MADVNDGPVAADDENTGDEDTDQTGNVLDNDDDVDGDITVKDTGTFDTANGSITIAADGEYTYTPDENYNGSDSFEYTIVDDDGAESTATLDLTIDDINDGPVAADDENTGDEDTDQTGNVLDNDDDVDGDITVKDTGTFDTANGS